MIISFFEALTAFALTLIAHLIVCRVLGPSRFMMKTLAMGGGGLLGYALLQWMMGVWDLVALYLFWSFWCSTAIVFINLMNSVTLSMLEALVRAGGELPREAFNAFVSEEKSIGDRLQAMKLNGFLVQDGDEWVMTPRARLFARGVLLFRRAFGITDIG